jgi:hypothetical protein
MEYLTRSRHGGLSYHKTSKGGHLVIPVSWSSAEDFMADLEAASQAAFGLTLDQAKALPGKENGRKLQEAFEAVIIDRMRRK